MSRRPEPPETERGLLVLAGFAVVYAVFRLLLSACTGGGL